MAEKTIEDKVKDIIVEQLGVNPEQVTTTAKFIEDLGADSLDTVELVMAFEENSMSRFPTKRPKSFRPLATSSSTSKKKAASSLLSQSCKKGTRIGCLFASTAMST